MFAVGLTGGIGSGKSTAAQLFAAHGVRIIDTDLIAHALTAPGAAALSAIAQRFGAELILADGSLDRASLRALVFADTAARHALEAILHPRIRQEVADRLAESSAAPYTIVVVPLLFETGVYTGSLQRSLVVDCPEALQVKRAMARSHLLEADVRRIMQAQLARGERLARADDVIVNDGDLENLKRQVDHMHKKYIRLA